MPNIETEIRRQYSVMRSGVLERTPITVLHIGAERTGLATGSDIEPQAVLALGIGSQKTARNCFMHVPPTPGEMENAIAAVEDEVTRARTMLVGRSLLFTSDAAIREIALVAGVPAGPVMTLSLDVMERTFGRLAAVALGRPALREGLPTDLAFAATLLILREVMHHLQFSSVTVKAAH